MINPIEFRLGNYLMQKVQNRIVTLPCTPDHFALLANGQAKDLFPVMLKAEVFEKCGFEENKKYALLPAAREFRLVLPVIGVNQNEIMGYVKSNQECFARATVNGLPVSNNVFHLHQLQNLFFALTGQELTVSIK
ncbi:MAG TPA: hypothetical protein VHK91_04960 [Flavisolibacter sp.]|jgi:hypothetical protein|nr:hypothetical protein [Flavisolibacter sp.]